MNRRDFGRRISQTAALLGLNRVSPGLLGVPLVGCGSTSGEGEQGVVIVGSGYGAAVAALRLTEAGILDVVGPDTMRVSLGRGFGGGSLVNLAV